jgi:hypothetical protein
MLADKLAFILHLMPRQFHPAVWSFMSIISLRVCCSFFILIQHAPEQKDSSQFNMI